MSEIVEKPTTSTNLEEEGKNEKAVVNNNTQKPESENQNLLAGSTHSSEKDMLGDSPRMKSDKKKDPLEQTTKDNSFNKRISTTINNVLNPVAKLSPRIPIDPAAISNALNPSSKISPRIPPKANSVDDLHSIDEKNLNDIITAELPPLKGHPDSGFTHKTNSLEKEPEKMEEEEEDKKKKKEEEEEEDKKEEEEVNEIRKHKSIVLPDVDEFYSKDASWLVRTW